MKAGGKSSPTTGGMHNGPERTADGPGNCRVAEDQPGPGPPDDTEWGTSGGEGGAGVPDTRGLSEGIYTGQSHVTAWQQASRAIARLA